MSYFDYVDSNLAIITDKDVIFPSEEDCANYFSNSLRMLRRHCNYSVVELAKILGMPHQTLSSYETASRMPSFMQAIRITTFFGFDIEEFILFGGDFQEVDIRDVYDENKKTN